MSHLDHLRSFLAVHRLSSMTAAAHSLGLTQPAVTGHIKALESRLGRRLFERAGRGIVPTASADALAQRIAFHIDTLEQSFSAFAAHGDDAGGVVTIGGPAEFMAEIALPALAAANDHGVTVHAQFGHTRGLIERLERAELDIVIATQRMTSAAIVYERLFRETFLLVAAPRFADLLALPGETSALAAALEAAPWAAYDASLPLIRRFFRNGLGRDPALQRISTAPDLRAVLGLVQAGAGLSVLPDYLCARALANGSIIELWRPQSPASNTLWTASNKRGNNRRVSLVASLLRRISGTRQDGESLE
jgi:DNA-binding transcriptional LysR family regulator